MVTLLAPRRVWSITVSMTERLDPDQLAVLAITLGAPVLAAAVPEKLT